MGKQLYGAGIWHFATYVDRYATDGYGDPVTLPEAWTELGWRRPPDRITDSSPRSWHAPWDRPPAPSASR